MRILVIGAGGVGSAFVPTALRRDFFEGLVVADYDESRAMAVAKRAADPRVSAARIDASDRAAMAALIRDRKITHVLNAVDPRFVMPIFEACLEAGVHYLDMAMSLSKPHPERPHQESGVKLGDEQFALAAEWESQGLLALVGIGVEPGLSDIFARYAADQLFETIDEVGVRDGANLVVEGYDFAPSFSIWTTIEECLNPPVIWEQGRGWFTTPPFSEPEVFDFPEGIGPVECVNVEHEEVLLIPRWVKARRVTFKYGLGNEFIEVLKVLHKLGDEQFALAAEWESQGLLALVGIGVEPGLSDVFARYAADQLFESIDEIGVRDGANLVVEGYDFAPSFSIWTTIEECLNPPVIWEKDRGWFTTPPFSEPEVFDFPEGIGPVECVNVEHEEVLLIPRWVKANRVTFKYGLGNEFIEVLKVLHKLGLDRTGKVRVGGAEVSPRDVVAAVLPDPATLGDKMSGKTCAGTWVTGTGKDGRPKEVYLYHVVDNAWSMAEYGSQAVVWQTAVNPVVALELLATGVWAGAGVLGPEAFDPVPFLQLLNDYGSPWGIREGADQAARVGG